MTTQSSMLSTLRSLQISSPGISGHFAPLLSMRLRPRLPVRISTSTITGQRQFSSTIRVEIKVENWVGKLTWVSPFSGMNIFNSVGITVYSFRGHFMPFQILQLIIVPRLFLLHQFVLG